jgi:succinate dehydrogenase hydrophobic anchor subunit
MKQKYLPSALPRMLCKVSLLEVLLNLNQASMPFLIPEFKQYYWRFWLLILLLTEQM